MNPIGTPSKATHTPLNAVPTEQPAPLEFNLPPVDGSLPYTKNAYENLPPEEKTPGLDFLILGKIPGGKRDASMPAEPLTPAFNEVVSECLKRGELNALDFLWRESGRDPNNSTIKLKLGQLDAETADSLCEHCRIHRGLTAKLAVLKVDESAITPLISLITKGKIVDLLLNGYGIATEPLRRLASVLGQVTHKLVLSAAKFDIHSEKALGESLLNSPCLKVLELYFCYFGASLGKQFTEGMMKNKSIVYLKMVDTPLVPTLMSGYGVMLAKNTRLEKLIIQNQRPLPVDDDEIHLEVILMAAANNPSLQRLNLINGGESSELAHPGHLIYLLKKNRTLTELTFNVFLPPQHHMSLIEALRENTTLIDFSLSPQGVLDHPLAQAIDDMLARNRALSNGQFLQKAGWAFDPLLSHNGLSDVGTVIARYLLQNTSSLEEFTDTLAVIELSMKEIAQSASTSDSDESLSSTTRTTADTSTTTITTTTTTTTMTTITGTMTPPSGSLSS